jgi:hypothetical protein
MLLLLKAVEAILLVWTCVEMVLLFLDPKVERLIKVTALLLIVVVAVPLARIQLHSTDNGKVRHHSYQQVGSCYFSDDLYRCGSMESNRR